MSAVTEQPTMRRRALWSFLAQGLASMNGLIATIVAARVMAPEEFGYFAALLVIALLFVGLISSLLAQPLLLTRGDPGRIAEQARSTLLAALIFGALAGVLLVGASVFLPDLREGLWILAVAFPLVASSDTFRYFGTVLGRAYLAALLEVVRLVLFLGAFVAFFSGSRQDATSLTLLWAGCAGVVGMLALGIGVRITRAASADLRQFANPKFIGYQFSAEYFLGTFGSTFPTLSLGFFVSVSAIGYFRGVSTLFGPIVVLATTAVMVLTPFLVTRTRPQRTRVLVGMAAAFSSATVAWMSVLLLLPASYGEELLGDVWAGSQDLILPVGLQVVGIGILTTAQTGVRVVRPRYSFVLNVSAITWAVVCFLIGVNLGGLNGAAWGFTVGAFGAAAIAVWIWVRVKDSHPEEAS